MPKAKRTRKFAQVKRMISPRDGRLKTSQEKQEKKKEKEKGKAVVVAPQTPSGLFFRYNAQLGPPYRILLDTNFINFSVSNKLDIRQAMMDCLLAECIPCITDCVIAELEKVPKFRVALKVARDPAFTRLPCTHRGTYADDCIVARVRMHRCYIVGTNDKGLQRRIRTIPGVPILFVGNHKYQIERMPDAVGAM